MVNGHPEHHGTDEHEEDEKERLAGARVHRHHEDAQTYVVLAEVEQAGHPENLEHREEIVGKVQLPMVGQVGEPVAQGEDDNLREHGDYFDDVQTVLEESVHFWTNDALYDEFAQEEAGQRYV